MPPSPLKLFTVPSITRRVSLSLLAELFGRFTHLLPNKYSLPKPSVDNESYFDSLAQILEQPSDLPDPLIHALREIEAIAAALLAAPDSSPGSDPAETESSGLRQAIQIWLRSHPQSNSPLVQQSIPAPGPAAPIPHSPLPTPHSASVSPHYLNFPIDIPADGRQLSANASQTAH